ncbi:type II toxin-antitoxin system Phd/YefM family antitoxin [Acidisphaera sp. S103]|uniref:type II toxin-antitoxin system Phd/YefM family antitoxin n=1 Tax=Acidisphaera sp. S103 TaxID=1747223 RepID=UPI00131B4C41|nr:type II toxin-antitoxin system Phd/YefM family antitoxin [Acidisphaera sp. S103]
MRTWQAAEARHKFADVVDAAVGGEPQLIERRDGKKVVLVSKDYFEATKPTIKTFLLNAGYSGEGEEEFDRILEGVRCDFPDLLSRRVQD